MVVVVPEYTAGEDGRAHPSEYSLLLTLIAYMTRRKYVARSVLNMNVSSCLDPDFFLSSPFALFMMKDLSQIVLLCVLHALG